MADDYLVQKLLMWIRVELLCLSGLHSMSVPIAEAPEQENCLGVPSRFLMLSAPH